MLFLSTSRHFGKQIQQPEVNHFVSHRAFSLSGWSVTTAGSPGKWSQVQACQSSRSIWIMLLVWWLSFRYFCKDQMILIDPFQLEIFYELLWFLHVLTSGIGGLWDMTSGISREAIFLMVVTPKYPTSLSVLTLLSTPAAQEPWRGSGPWCLMNSHYCCDMSMTRDLCNYSLLTCLYNWLRQLPVSPSENSVCSTTTKKPSLNLAHRGYAAQQ